MLLRKDNGVHSDSQKSQKRFCSDPRTSKGQPESKEKASKEKADRHCFHRKAQHHVLHFPMKSRGRIEGKRTEPTQQGTKQK